jgi:XapX domain-containing protein
MGYIISLGVGFGVGLLYWLLKVQSPAPPLIALAGLLGMVLGEHAIPVVKAQLFAQTTDDAGRRADQGRRCATAGDAGRYQKRRLIQTCALTA